MVYRAIGLMSGSSLDGLDIVFAELEENGGKWSYQLLEAECSPYDEGLRKRLASAASLNALEYQLLHASYGQYLGETVNAFIDKHGLQYKIALVGSHGHTVFHLPQARMTAQLGDGAAIAAITRLPVVSDLRSMDIALGGQGAPIVPAGERLLFPAYEYFLNIGGIANLSRIGEPPTAFDICAANRVLNLLAGEAGKMFDENGALAASGAVNQQLLDKLNALEYYSLPYPKSLDNEWSSQIVYPMVKAIETNTADALRTYTEHIAIQVARAVQLVANPEPSRMLCTGGGAFNTFLMERIRAQLSETGLVPVVPEPGLVKFKEALIMALLAVLRWREETNVFSMATGAARDSVGGAMWMGQED